MLGVGELLKELQIDIEVPAQLKIDSQAAIKQLESEATSTLAKHVDVRVQFVRQRVSSNAVIPTYIASVANVADIMTETVSIVKLDEHRTCLGIRKPSASESEECYNARYIADGDRRVHSMFICERTSG